MWKYKELRSNQLTLGIWCRPSSQHPLPPARHQPYLLISSTQTINQEKTKNPEMRPSFQQVLSYCVDLRTQNPGVTEVDLKRSHKRDSDKINMLKLETPKRKQVVSYSLDSHMGPIT